MSEHLTECEMASPQCAGRASGETHRGVMFCLHCQRRCICNALRACEQRVEETWSAIAGRDQYAEGYADALDAARAAVDSISPIDQLVYEGFISLVYDKGEILAAIDELRNKK